MDNCCTHKDLLPIHGADLQQNIIFKTGQTQRSMEVNTEDVDIKADIQKVKPFEQLLNEEEDGELDREDERVTKEDSEDLNEERHCFTEEVESKDGEVEVKIILQDAESESKRQRKFKTEDNESTVEVNQEQMGNGEMWEEKNMDFVAQKIQDVNEKNDREERSCILEGIKPEKARETDTVQEQDTEKHLHTTNAKLLGHLLDTVAARSRDRLSLQDTQKKIHRLTPDFPDSLYELLCSLQEGRRLNDQRCSFTLERRCHSEPSTPVLRHRVVFSSMTSLQKEEFFEFVATSQGRRLDDQRAELQDMPAPQPPCQSKASDRKTSLKGAGSKRMSQISTPKEELYNMILISQAQGRLEEQRSSAPGPMDDEDFFSLLLRVQGGRIDEQRTELPFTLRD
ncbi:hypothetical protein GJAV_G00009120 [Gymnothorax javanicus]|nr:hypothetical protein GJAV_G00009120 [Gymnothorax javanicus]